MDTPEMRSQEYVQIHALLYHLRRHLEREGDVPPEAFEAYDTQPVRPTHIHRSKAQHGEAIALLRAGLDDTVADAVAASATPTA